MSETKTKIVALNENAHDGCYSDDIKNLGADLVVYSYEGGGYEGSGFAVWRKGRKWFYSSLGHCSCNGPWDFSGEAGVTGITLAALRKVATEKNYDSHAVAVIDHVGNLNKKNARAKK